MLEAWQGYIAMEIELGHINEARSIYRRCYSKRFPGTGSEVYAFTHTSDLSFFFFKLKKGSSTWFFASLFNLQVSLIANETKVISFGVGDSGIEQRSVNFWNFKTNL